MNTEQKLGSLLTEIGLDDEAKESIMNVITGLAGEDNCEKKPENKEKKLEHSEEHDKIASGALKHRILKVMNEFSKIYIKHTEVNDLYSNLDPIVVDALTACLEKAQAQSGKYIPFTPKQIDHICFQIGEWYLGMKPLLEGTHNLGYQKEKLKTMICGD